jgi:alanine racemase
VLTWCEIDPDALEHNIRALRSHVGSQTLLAPAVKSNGYGHGTLIAARAFLRGGADWLCVHQVSEARRLREAGLTCPLYVFGPITLDEVPEIISLDLRAVVYSIAHIERYASLASRDPTRPVRLHLKLETGNHRQGVAIEEAKELARRIIASPHLRLEGISSHFANIEDTTDHTYADRQWALFNQGAELVACMIDDADARRGERAPPLMRHVANSAATILWPDRAMSLARVGISAYGLWPSTETLSVARYTHSEVISLKPALTWKAQVSQVKRVGEGEKVGYGCTFTTTRPSLIAVLPVGYYEGYDRGLSNLAHVLIRGRRAPVRGRVCMNMTMVEVTDIPDVQFGDEAILLGASGREQITAEQIASWANTINYEVITRIAGHIPRVPVTAMTDLD